MKKAYLTLKKYFPLIVIGISIIGILGATAFTYAYDRSVLTLNYNSPIVAAFLILVVLAFAFIVVLSIHLRGMRLNKIKKHTRLTSFCAIFAAIMTFGAFINDILNITLYDMSYNVIQYIKMVLSLGVCVYFIIESLPRFINRKWVIIPAFIRKALSICAILWAVLGVFVSFFTVYKNLTTTSIILTTHTLAHVAMALFFIYEAGREFVKGKYAMLIFSSLTTALICLAFSGALVVCVMIGTMNVSDLGFTVFEHFATASIGLFAISRTYSILKTLRLVLINDSQEI